MPSSATSSRPSLPSQRQEIVTWVAWAWRSTLVTASWAMRHSSRSWRIGRRPVSWVRRWTVEAAAVLAPARGTPRAWWTRLWRLGDVGAQVVERVAHLADHARARRCAGCRATARGVAAAGAVLHDAVELEGEVGERLADAVVEVAGDAGALLVGADGAQAAEPAGVVDGERGRLDEAGQQLDVAAGEVVRRRRARWTTQADDRPAGRQHGVEARGRARGEARAAAGEEVLLAHRGCGAAAARASGRREVVRRRSRSGGRVPSRRSVCQRPSVSSSTRRATASNSNSSLSWLHRGVEHLVEVERGRAGSG